ncbi:MAG: response regulator, partial [Geobacteraceae bacterium]|nr:response regulator [Geobacteraceae bacterium]
MKERAKILLVEDEDLSRDSLTRLLKMSAFHVKGAASGNMGLSLLAHEEFDIVITDLLLPDGNGIDILKRAK